MHMRGGKRRWQCSLFFSALYPGSSISHWTAALGRKPSPHYHLMQCHRHPGGSWDWAGLVGSFRGKPWIIMLLSMSHSAFFPRTRNLSLKTSNRISPRILHKDVCLCIVPVTQMSLALALFQVPTLYICFDAICSLQPNSYSPKRLTKSSPGSNLLTPKEHVGRIEYMGGWSGQSWCQ